MRFLQCYRTRPEIPKRNLPALVLVELCWRYKIRLIYLKNAALWLPDLPGAHASVPVEHPFSGALVPPVPRESLVL